MNFKGLLVGMCAIAGVAAQNAGAACLSGPDGVKDNEACYTLFAGQTTNAGSVCIELTANDQLVVTYETTGGWELTAAHLWVGGSKTGYPQTKNANPIPGQFPYKSGDITGLTSYSFTIPLTSFPCGFDYYMAAHAAVRKLNADGTYRTETGWSDGPRMVDRGNWATYSSFTLACGPCVDPVGTTCAETAFARSSTSSTCFLSLKKADANAYGCCDLSGQGNCNSDCFSRWGWTNGPLAPGSYTFDIWAAAGQCDLANGTNVGSLAVVYDSNGVATVTYTINAPYTLDDTHLYVGSAKLPPDGDGGYTLAPGQYPNTGGTASYEVSGLSGSIYVVAHAVVGGFPEGTCDPLDLGE